MQVLKVEYIRESERGRLTQIITRNFKQLNLLEIKKDCVFGGHYHKKKEESFYVIRGKVRVQISVGDKDKVYTFNPADCFLVECWDKHTITALEDSIIVETLSEPYTEEDVYE